MSRASGAARRVYDEILNAAPNSICPLCGIGIVRSLDHYLPQSKYPEYVVTPANLIPSCIDCNKAKFTRFPQQAAQQTIHPYFDNYTQETWLRAEVIEGEPPALRFYADGPGHWSSIDRERVNIISRSSGLGSCTRPMLGMSSVTYDHFSSIVWQETKPLSAYISRNRPRRAETPTSIPGELRPTRH